jgi:hypothetical protein
VHLAPSRYRISVEAESWHPTSRLLLNSPHALLRDLMQLGSLESNRRRPVGARTPSWLLICRPVDCQIRTSPKGRGGPFTALHGVKTAPRSASNFSGIPWCSNPPKSQPASPWALEFTALSDWQAAVSRPPPCFLVETLVHRNPHLSTSGTSAQQVGQPATVKGPSACSDLL